MNNANKNKPNSNPIKANFPDLKILILPDMLDILLKNYKFRRLLVC